MSDDLEKRAEEWLLANDWHYVKYGDSRPDRSAYDTLMMYEITPYLADAYIAGARAERERLDQGNGLTRFDEMRHRVLQEENARLIAELNEQAKLNGMGSEREAKLRAALEWYADEHHWQAIHAKEQLPLAVVDGGEIARRALGHE